METGLSEANRIDVMQEVIGDAALKIVEQLQASDSFKHFNALRADLLAAQDRAFEMPTPENVRELQLAHACIQNWYKNLVQKQPEVKVLQGLTKLLKELKQMHIKRALEARKILAAIGPTGPDQDQPCEGCSRVSCNYCPDLHGTDETN